ncbi:hypothetical protein DQ04_03351080 [Trypanosoma grayi]|uniref:hypothetical protein n=1 Tax=Trypanosoma grayi TaxID=71804 RepID=UPI0004F40947|nr:hypothetical protein DQ04_03351080 [Trypanosoma grayi]KEG10745.1 hypothetical protein DQ04_03351080 [Trypanosoma grayi]
MELDSIKLQMRELQRYYDDDTKSDDDIIYAVYNWVKSAHVVAQLLLLEGRFPELRRCLDLCRQVLEEQHVEGGGRTVIQGATGEDRLLMNALLLRTTQLQTQYEEARKKSTGRDTQYYIRKLLRTGEDEAARGSFKGVEKRPVSPPERGVSFGRRTRLNRWKVPPILPALVTQSQPFLRSAADGYGDVSTDARARRAEARRLTDEMEDQDDAEALAGDAAMTPAAPAIPVAVVPEARGVTANAMPCAERTEPPSIEAEASRVRPYTLPTLKTRAATGRKLSPGCVRLVRPRSAELGSATLPSGNVMYRLKEDAGAYVMKTAIAIKSANDTKDHAAALMQALHDRASSLLQRQHPSTDNLNGTDMGRESAAQDRDQSGDVMTENMFVKLPSYSSTCSVLSRKSALSAKNLHQGVPSPLKSPKTATKESEKSTCTSTPFQRVVARDTATGWLSEVLSDDSCRKQWTDTADLTSSLSCAARKQLEEVYKSYRQKRVELSSAVGEMRFKAADHIGLFKPQERVVQVEDTALWKSRRKLHAATSERGAVFVSPALESRLLPVTEVLDAESILNSSGAFVGGAPTPTVKMAAGSREVLPVEGIARLDNGEVSNTRFEQELVPTIPVTSVTTTASNGGRIATLTDEKVTPWLDGKKSSDLISEETLSTAKSAGLPPTSAQRRLTMLQGSIHIAFPDVHSLVVRRAEEQVEKERRLTKCGGILPVPPPSASPPRDPAAVTTGGGGAPRLSTLETVRGALNRLKQQNPVLWTPQLRALPRGSIGETHSCLETEPTTRRHSEATEMPQLVLFLSLDELRREPDWTCIDAASLSMCLVLHKAAVRVQCLCRSLRAKNERKRRAAAVEVHLVDMSKCEEGAITIQRYVRRFLARRLTLTILLRLSYHRDQQVTLEAAGDDAAPENVAPLGLPSALGIQKVSGTTVFQENHDASRRFTSGTRLSSSASNLRQRSLQSTPTQTFTGRLYALPVRGSCMQTTRLGRLRRIQESIAARVIVRACRVYMYSKLSKWKRETHALIQFVTGQLSAAEAFGSLGAGGTAALQIFPLSPERVTGDVIAAWEARTAEARRHGDLMTPLEPVKLSELRRILQQRHEAEEAELWKRQELRLQEEEEAQQKQRVRVDAVLLLQRCTRGYRARCWILIYQQKLQGLLTLHHRKAELLDNASLGMTHPHIVNANGKFSLAASLVDTTAYSEAHPVPPHVADVIMKGLQKRHPRWFVRDVDAYRKRLEAVGLLQTFLRWRSSLNVLADHFSDVNATLIQRRWRLLLRRRELLDTQKAVHMMETLESMEYCDHDAIM